MYICMPGEIVARTQRRAEEDAKNDAVEGAVAYYNDDIYLDEPYVRVEAKVGRKDTCPCGSGKKYKKCYLNVDETGKDIF